MNVRSSAAHLKDGRRGSVLPALARRETGAATAPLVILSAACAAIAAYEVHGAGASGALPFIDRVLRRFDLTALAGSVVFLVFRTAGHIETDHRDGWLAAFLAAAGTRRGYGTALLLTSMIAPAAMFATAALTFAVAVAVLTGSTELMRALPRTMGGGLLVLGTWSACVVAVGVALRRALPTAGIVALLVAAPAFLLLRYAFHDGATPAWVLLLQSTSPLLFLPPDGLNMARAFIYIGVAGGLAANLSHRYAGRMR